MDVSTKRQRIAELAKQAPELSFTSLNHYLDLDWLRVAYGRVRQDSAPGCDGETVESYGEHLEENLHSLLDRAKSGRYCAPPVKRVYIPKGSGKGARAIGMPTTEDKVLQRAVVMALEPIYEQDFLDCSYGFRPKRSAHKALEELWSRVMQNRIKWILEVDIRKYFDTMDHAQLRELLQRRVRDGVIKRLIGKWLKAGVLEGESVRYPEKGTPQGGVVSPMLSNIYLHYVLDQWFESEVKPRLKGKAFMIRFADDFVMGFEHKEDAERVLEVLGKRLEKYGLSIHPEKTRLVPFGRPMGKGSRKTDRIAGPGTFDFLGFTHYWGRSRKGSWVVKRKTANSRYTRALKGITDWCRKNRHLPVAEQYKRLSRKIQGHYAYYGITGNGKWLQKFRQEAKKTWRKWLNRRSRKRGGMSWAKFTSLCRHYRLPPARVVHSVLVAKP
jgi:RNA-directed DNA polymerase